MKHVNRGQPVTLCTSHTTTPSTIPQGKHVINVFEYYWYLVIESLKHELYWCYNGSCSQGRSNPRDFLYSDVGDFCLTINNVQNNSKYILNINYINAISAPTDITFSVTCGGMCEHA